MVVFSVGSQLSSNKSFSSITLPLFSLIKKLAKNLVDQRPISVPLPLPLLIDRLGVMLPARALLIFTRQCQCFRSEWAIGRGEAGGGMRKAEFRILNA